MFKYFLPLLVIFLFFACEGVSYINDPDSGQLNNTNNINNINNTTNNGNENCTDGLDNDGDGLADCLDLDCLSHPNCNGNNNNNNDGSNDSTNDNPWQFDVDTGNCTDDQKIPCDSPVPTGCLAAEIDNNGLDDNCNGQIDEGGSNVCLPGAVRACFLGPPGRRAEGGCADGQQICLRTSGEFGTWGPCEGGISPSGESCDGLDNDCNGCIDDGLCCEPPINCPSSNDITLQGAEPFKDFVLDGGNYFSGQAYRWEWRVSTGPCDEVLGVTSYSVNGSNSLGYVATSEEVTLNFTLSGEYTIVMRVYYTPVDYYECVFILRVFGPGLRVETCWDNHDVTDVDLHLMKQGLGTAFCSASDCSYDNCKADNWNHSDWNLIATALDSCENTKLGPYWTTHHGDCKNPRLDLDNIFDSQGITPENSNIDVPGNGETYRIGVDYYYGAAGIITHPVVNIYCGGRRVATYGYPVQNQVTLSDSGGMGCATGHFWRVADVTTAVDGNGDVTCTVTSLADGGGNPYITFGNSQY